ncbi:MAG: serine/threonine protein kinase [Polyangiaceae bacterium]|nr:serine/threonine protein kinase [Polyangiaceae bacterium]
MVERAPAGLMEEGAVEQPPEEALPRQFGKYTLMRRLAAGGMAELFLALHRAVAGFEKLVVIKRILPSMNKDQAFIDMLLHEARIAATLSHPNIVQIFDVGQLEGKYFIAMEHIHGEDIRSIVRAMKKKNVAEFPLEHALSIVLGMCAGLAYAHEKRDLDGALLDIVHRDISPQNIVVTFTGDVKIVDFGIAKSGTQVGEDTKDGQLKGKVPYMSPEQAAGEPIDWRSDIFAVGVMLFELTTARRLFKGASEYETLKLICEKEYPHPMQVKPGYPAALDRIVMKALAKRREDRYQSARELQGDLEAFIREERIPVSQVSLTHWMQSLFEEKLNQQKEALQDIKQLADVIAAQHSSSMYEGTITNGAGMATGSGIIQAPPKRRGGLVAVLLAVAAMGLGVFLYLRHEAGLREGEARAREEAALGRQQPVEEEAKGWIEVSTRPDGCAIWINGDLRKEVTPAKIEKLPLGRELEVKLTKDGLEPYRETVTLTEAAPSKSISKEMAAGSVTVVLKVTPAPAVWIDGKPWKGKGGRIENVTALEEHKIVLSASGYVAKTVSFVAQPGETKVIEEQLLKPEPGGAGTSQPAGGGAQGKVRVGAKGGFCNVIVNGTPYGPTPVEATVPAGTARITCKPADGPAQSQAVKVSAGETARVSFKLD